MAYVLEISPEAEQAINEAERYHKDRDLVEGSDLLERIADKLDDLERNPNIYQVRYKDRRVASIRLKSFRYHLIYRIAPTDTPTVHILDFVSQSSDWLPAT